MPFIKKQKGTYAFIREDKDSEVYVAAYQSGIIYRIVKI